MTMRCMLKSTSKSLYGLILFFMQNRLDFHIRQNINIKALRAAATIAFMKLVKKLRNKTNEKFMCGLPENFFVIKACFMNLFLKFKRALFLMITARYASAFIKVKIICGKDHTAFIKHCRFFTARFCIRHASALKKAKGIA